MIKRKKDKMYFLLKDWCTGLKSVNTTKVLKNMKSVKTLKKNEMCQPFLANCSGVVSTKVKIVKVSI